MLRANQAVRLGLRAASRNAELSFAKGLINQGGNLLALLPIAFAAILIAALARGDALRSALLAARALAGLRWPVLGGIAAALSIALAASLLFWAGAVPLLAADAELNRRPPPGNFALLVSRGAARTVRSEEHTSELQSRPHLVCRLLLEKKKQERNALRGGRVEQDGSRRQVSRSRQRCNQAGVHQPFSRLGCVRRTLVERSPLRTGSRPCT